MADGTSNTGPMKRNHDALWADAKVRYIEMLIEMAKVSEGDAEEKLLDRIEKLLGYDSGTELGNAGGFESEAAP